MIMKFTDEERVHFKNSGLDDIQINAMEKEVFESCRNEMDQAVYLFMNRLGLA